MSSSPLSVLIMGGGIGGLCLAQALKGAGVHVTVYERNPSPTDWLQGYRININPVGSRALHDCLPPALWDAFLASAGRPSEGIGFLTEQLKELLVITEGFVPGEGDDSTHGHHPVNRIALRHVLLGGLDDVLHFGKTFERYEQTPDGKVTAFFTDGSSAAGDVLVGADGANSHVRQQYLPHAGRVETGALGVGGKLLLTDETRQWLPTMLSTRMNTIMPLARYFMFCAAFNHAYTPAQALSRVGANTQAVGLNPDLLFEANNDDYILWAFIAHRDAYPDNRDTLDGSELQHLVSKMIADWHPDLRRMVAASDPASIGLLSLKTSVQVAPWQTTNVTLLGDSIHSMTPLAGLGANMALRDASVLSRKLIAVEHGEQALLPALHGYEAQMLHYGFTAVRTSLQNTQRAISNKRRERLMGRAWFRLCKAIPALKQRTFGTYRSTSSS